MKTIKNKIFVFGYLSAALAINPLPVQAGMKGQFIHTVLNLSIPDADSIIEEGVSREYPHATFEEVWDAVIVIMMQKGMIMNSSKESGILVSLTDPPLALIVSRGEKVKINLKTMEYIYHPSGPAEEPELFSKEEKKEVAKVFFDYIATEVYSGKKWKYLYQGS